MGGEERASPLVDKPAAGRRESQVSVSPLFETKFATVNYFLSTMFEKSLVLRDD